MRRVRSGHRAAEDFKAGRRRLQPPSAGLLQDAGISGSGRISIRPGDPQEQGVWEMAAHAYREIEGTDAEDALSDLDE